MADRRAPTTDELASALGEAWGEGIRVTDRRPFAYASSAPLERLTVVDQGGRESELVFKDLSIERQLPDARNHRPELFYASGRETAIYRDLLGPKGIGLDAFLGFKTDGALAHRSDWLFVRFCNGPTLWQVGELEHWGAVAEWLGNFHVRFTASDALDEVVPWSMTASWLEQVAQRGLAAIRRAGTDQSKRVAAAVSKWIEGGATWHLAESRRGLTHGEFYPSNVLLELGSGAPAVFPVDWETAGVGPQLLDLAALVSGLPDADHDYLVRRYEAVAGSVNRQHLRAAAVHLSLRWLGWADSWEPPSLHRQDWMGTLENHLSAKARDSIDE